MVVRDGAAGLEVLVQRRSPDLVFVPGAHAFPGGRVEPADHEPHPTTGPVLTDDEASARLGVTSGGLAYWVAAVREIYEEVGLLVGDGPVDAIADLRGAVDRGERDFAAVCHDHGIALRLGDLRYFGHWTTPPGAPRRYSTRFFVTPAPPGQQPCHDGNEAVDCEWIRPDDALAHFATGTWELILPTERSLRAIARFAAVADLLTHLDADPPLTDDHGGRRVVLPAEDAGIHQEIPT
jgi:8-oxo-dGTP pyrophosphatase MutT (NUDIX family)